MTTARGPLAPGDVLAVDPSVELFTTEDGVVGVGPTGVFELGDVDVEGLHATLETLDGRRTVAEVAAALAHRYVAEDVVGLLAQLDGVVLQRVAAGPPRAVPTGGKGRVAVVGAGRVASAITAELVGAGFAVDRTEARDGAELGAGDLEARLAGVAMTVCALADVKGRAFLDVGEAGARAGTPVLFVAFERGRFTVGPLHVPGRSPCFACARLSTTWKELFEASGPSIVPRLTFGAPRGGDPAHGLARLVGEVRAEVERVVSGTSHPQRLGSVISIAEGGDVVVRPVYAVATCPSCQGTFGAAIVDESAPPQRLLARGAADVCDATGGSRSVRPEEAARRALAAFERLGVQARCEPLPDDSPAAFAAIDCPFFSLSVEPRFRADAAYVFPAPKGACFGKGTTELQARCSAYYEWFERNLAVWRGDRDLVRAPWERVRGCAIDMPYVVSGSLPGLAQEGLHAFDPRAPIDWIWARCLRRDAPILVPARAVYLCGTLFRGSAIDMPRAGSSGLSAGCSPGDAVLQGLLEIVERDATFTAIRNGSVHPDVPVASVEDPASHDLLARIAAAGYEPRLRDLTSTIGVPTFEAYVVKPGEWGNHFAMGYGAHLDARVALRRAITEAVQTLFGGAPAGVADPLRADSSFFEVFPHRWQALDRRGPARPPQAPSSPPGDVWDQIDEVVARIVAANPRADVCVVDLSPPELDGVHVVRAIVTGMLDEARGIQLHVPQRCRLRPLEEMYLGRIAM